MPHAWKVEDQRRRVGDEVPQPAVSKEKALSPRLLYGLWVHRVDVDIVDVLDYLHQLTPGVQCRRVQVVQEVVVVPILQPQRLALVVHKSFRQRLPVQLAHCAGSPDVEPAIQVSPRRVAGGELGRPLRGALALGVVDELLLLPRLYLQVAVHNLLLTSLEYHVPCVKEKHYVLRLRPVEYVRADEIGHLREAVGPGRLMAVAQHHWVETVELCRAKGKRQPWVHSAGVGDCMKLGPPHD
mmetsp:Transcript_126755/g.370472  ORF Transcript_126755/g.370472 Transcript_126755/m.370472 type:complete len:240 (-) Transcript_126755:43-762(-)